MFESLRLWLLRVLRVPPEPEPPFGDPASTRVFRASHRYYSLRLLGWGIGQFLALFSLIVGFCILYAIDRSVTDLRAKQTSEPPPQIQGTNAATSIEVAPAKTIRKARGKRGLQDIINDIARFLVKVPRVCFFLIWILKMIGVVFFVVQFFVSYTVLRLDYEMRWYVVTDRSLRIRTGIWKVQELTMSFANLQQVVLSQGPVQRLLGIADVRVQSAGGGALPQHGHHPQLQSLHTGYFHGVDNAPEVRDLILARLRHFQETGLGHPDEVRRPLPFSALPNTAGPQTDADAIFAARELLVETRQLRKTVGG